VTLNRVHRSTDIRIVFYTHLSVAVSYQIQPPHHLIYCSQSLVHYRHVVAAAAAAWEVFFRMTRID